MNTKELTHLICHDHDLPITQTLQGFWVTVVFLVLKTKDLDDIVDFSVFHNLRTKTHKTPLQFSKLDLGFLM